MVHNSTLQIVLRSLNHMIADERGRGDPNGLVRGLIMARAQVRSFVPATAREVDIPAVTRCPECGITVFQSSNSRTERCSRCALVRGS